ncbi:hypothetical protein RGR602_CH01421 [Rhizobium gallicum bv. gallicum R602sp]|uniref:Uncharacterized protein n=1 Tax=Rhizobium gallicum bv. gallicum R602sp TaxID=1041138 RepID=A0A0B4X2I9_9HYPH|nr:hypothetical protein RGR602_CH01421 [Rhizobium gallicum bv. gallicum R602sp]
MNVINGRGDWTRCMLRQGNLAIGSTEARPRSAPFNRVTPATMGIRCRARLYMGEDIFEADLFNKHWICLASTATFQNR